MVVAFSSDVHTDFWCPIKDSGAKAVTKIHDFVDNVLKPKEADILILAGDNSHYNSQNKIMLEYLASKKMYKKIFVVHGNHEMYLISNSQHSQYSTSFAKIQELKEICEAIDTVEFLDGNIVEVDGVKIGGCAMWYDGSYGIKSFGRTKDNMLALWKVSMNDANLIKGIDTDISNPPQMYSYGSYKFYNFNPWTFFEKEKEKMVKIVKECQIFVSHVGPVVPKNLQPKYQSADTGFYYFDGEHYLWDDNAPKLWVYGHTHDMYDFKINNTWLACNPLGYKSENTGAEIQVIEMDNLY